MLSGNVTEKSNLSYLPKSLQNAIEYLKNNDLTIHEPGRFELDGDNLILQVLDLTTSPREMLVPERHEKYIDVQFLASGGPENIAWYPDLNNNIVKENLLETPRDICFYENNPHVQEGIIPMSVGSFAVFFPWDIHIPAIAASTPANIRKIVLKVKFSTCV